MKSAAIILAVLAGLWLGPAEAQVDPLCGDAGDACRIDGGSYHIALPAGWDGQSSFPAIVFFHGHRSSGKAVLNGGVRSVFTNAGYAVIAPNGPRRDGENYRFWPAREMQNPPRDNIAFTSAVLEDVAKKFDLERDRILVGGFSAGGSMAWRIACAKGPLFAGYVSVAGALRRPTPAEECPGGPVRLLHIHGFGDKQVPLEGRQIRDWHQGDVFESLSLLRATNGCRSDPQHIADVDKYSCRLWTSCNSGRDIQFCMHSGGHGLPKGWAEMALQWFERPDFD
ncbi:MAG: prolyl oligopeptidase family serine peptidase [Pseudomonadota bacterium]